MARMAKMAKVLPLMPLLPQKKNQYTLKLWLIVLSVTASMVLPVLLRKPPNKVLTTSRLRRNNIFTTLSPAKLWVRVPTKSLFRRNATMASILSHPAKRSSAGFGRRPAAKLKSSLVTKPIPVSWNYTIDGKHSYLLLILTNSFLLS